VIGSIASGALRPHPTLACVSACKTHTHADAESAQFKTATALGLDMPSILITPDDEVVE
jgi:hypothetical protein